MELSCLPRCWVTSIFHSNKQASFTSSSALRWNFQDDISTWIREAAFRFALEKHNTTKLEDLLYRVLTHYSTWYHLCILCPKKWTQELFCMMLWRPENNHSVCQPLNRVLRSSIEDMCWSLHSEDEILQCFCSQAVVRVSCRWKKWLITGTSNWASSTCGGFSFLGKYNQVADSFLMYVLGILKPGIYRVEQRISNHS